MTHRAIKKGIGALWRLLEGHGAECRCPECSGRDALVELVDGVTEASGDAARVASAALTKAGGLGGLVKRKATTVTVTVDGKPARAEFVSSKKGGK